MRFRSPVIVSASRHLRASITSMLSPPNVSPANIHASRSPGSPLGRYGLRILELKDRRALLF